MSFCFFLLLFNCTIKNSAMVCRPTLCLHNQRQLRGTCLVVFSQLAHLQATKRFDISRFFAIKNFFRVAVRALPSPGPENLPSPRIRNGLGNIFPRSNKIQQPVHAINEIYIYIPSLVKHYFGAGSAPFRGMAG